MRLYYSSAACSLAPHIVAREAGVDLDLTKVNLVTHKTEDGHDLHAISPSGYVPALQLDNGQFLTEAAVLVQYLADLKPQAELIPAAGTLERYRALEWLNFIATELHKGMSPLWYPATPEATKMAVREKLAKRLTYLEERLTGQGYLTGDRFTAPDAYAFAILNWAGPLKIDLSPWPTIKAYVARIAGRPAVRRALISEGLIQDAAAA